MMLQWIMMLVMMLFGQTSSTVEEKTGKTGKQFSADTKSDLTKLNTRLGTQPNEKMVSGLNFLQKPKTADSLDIAKKQQEVNLLLKLFGGVNKGYTVPVPKKTT